MLGKSAPMVCLRPAGLIRLDWRTRQDDDADRRTRRWCRASLLDRCLHHSGVPLRDALGSLPLAAGPSVDFDLTVMVQALLFLGWRGC